MWNLCNSIGSSHFFPDETLEQQPMQNCMKWYGGLIPEEIHVAISLRVLAGLSYLDFGPLFHVGTTSI